MKKIILATRGSKLALAQAEQVKALIEGKGVACDILIIKTKGDKNQNRPIQEIGGDGLFIREIEKALLDGSADIAVHSAKDLPYKLAEGLVIAGNPKAASAADCLISPKYDVIERRRGLCDARVSKKAYDTATGKISEDSEACGKRKIIGTGSPRRIREYSLLDKNAVFKGLRGNINTRIGKLDAGEYDAIILARAGLDRLNIDLSDYNVREFSKDEMIPAACQGIIAIECRKDDEEIVNLIAEISDFDTRMRFEVERSLFCRMEADCSSALGVHADFEGDTITLRALIDDKKVCLKGSFDKREELCRTALQELTEEL